MYSTNLTDSQWEGISIFFDQKRKRAYPLRNIVNAIMYISKTGVQWHLLPKEFSPYGITYYYFKKWKTSGLWQKILLHQTKQVRIISGKSKEPMTVIFDSQSIKNSERGANEKEFDGHKKIQGRKRHLVTDSNGRLLTTLVGPGNEHNLPAAKRRVERIKLLQLPNVNLIVADGVYLGLIEWVKANFAGEKFKFLNR